MHFPRVSHNSSNSSSEGSSQVLHTRPLSSTQFLTQFMPHIAHTHFLTILHSSPHNFTHSSLTSSQFQQLLTHPQRSSAPVPSSHHTVPPNFFTLPPHCFTHFVSQFHKVLHTVPLTIPYIDPQSSSVSSHISIQFLVLPQLLIPASTPFYTFLTMLCAHPVT